MSIKRLMALLVAAAMTVGMIPTFVFAKGFDYEPDGKEAVESSEAEEEESKPEVKETSTSKPKAEEPAEKKDEEPEEPKTEETKESEDKKPEDKKPEEPKTQEPSESKDEETAESKVEEPAESDSGEPADAKDEEPAGTEGEDPAEDVPEEDETISEEELKKIKVTVPDISIKVSGSKDNDERFNRYVESKFGFSSPSPYKRKATVAGTLLTGLDKALYDQLKPQIKNAADGKNLSTTFKVEPVSVTWTSKQLGGVALFEYDSAGNRSISVAAQKAVVKKLNLLPVINALLADCPYELYWYDKEQDVPITEIYIGAKLVKGVYVLYFSSMYISFPVEEEYAASGNVYKINNEKISKVNDSIANAQKIVDEAKSKSTDYEKLLYYSQQICDLVEYDKVAAHDDTMPYGDPWQLVSVFDADPKTNVVCEGYSKAFKYLCDQTSFKNSKISCILATGTMKVNSNSGGHMWNIVKMEDGKNYLVDVTNCDTGTIGYPDKLFLAGYLSGSKDNGYYFKAGYSAVNYIYDSLTTSTFNTDLVLTNLCYLPAGLSGKCGDNLDWSISGHTLTISGTGDMQNFSYSNGTGAPWEKYALGIQNVVISDGVTSIGNFAFSNFLGIKSIKLPYGLTRIGEYAFDGCISLTGIKIPNTVGKIGNNAFRDCINLSRVTIEESLHASVSGLFDSCTKAVFYDYVVAGDYELQITNPSVNGTGTVTFIGMSKPTQSVVIPAVADINGVTYKVNRIAADAFTNDKEIRTLSIGSNVVTIDGNAFYGCSNLTKVSGGYRLKTIGSNAFAYCPKLSSFTVTSKVLNKIGSYAFNKDGRLKTLNIKKTKKLSKKGVKNSLKGSSVKTVKVKKSKVRKYKKYFKKKNSGRKVKVKK